MRLFVAVSLSEEMRRTLIGLMHQLKRQGVEGNYVPAQNLHLTLAFIGEYPDPEKVKAVIDSLSFPAFRLSLGDTGNFGDVFWIGVKGNQKLKSYVKELRDALAAAGIPCDKGKFIPHITLVRKFSSRSALKLPVPKGEMTVKKASLMKSEFKNGKTMYVEL
ncbi:MAG TPA: RNA 2',3'-cyclic phosphodiesterase [Candidatus Cottocaccamicrobium excrementipullorum]|nr:RNA 2',3'-cyclic phosphodiesterase [Candidatus Cottocaccamicrobium excrementipullorum]